MAKRKTSPRNHYDKLGKLNRQPLSWRRRAVRCLTLRTYGRESGPLRIAKKSPFAKA